MIFREARVQDAPEIVELLRILRVESPEYNYADDDPQFVTANLDKLLYLDALVGIVAVDYGKIVGFMIGFIGAPWYSKRVEAMEQLLYVHPEFRGSTIAMRLIRLFEQLCKKRGAAVLNVGASTGMNEDRTVKLYERMGYTQGSPTLRKAL